MNKKRLLLVEDDTELRDFYREFLSENYLVETAVDGEDGWSKLVVNKFDLIVLDIMMPKLDGLGFLKRKSKDLELSKIPTVMLTNLGNDDVLKRSFELGAKYYILKAETMPDKILPVLEKALTE